MSATRLSTAIVAICCLSGTIVPRLGTLSHHGPDLFTGHLTWAWGPVYSAAPLLPPVGGPAVEAKPYELSPAVTVHATLPDGWSAGRLHVTAVTADGEVAARATVDVDRSTAPHIGDDKRA